MKTMNRQQVIQDLINDKIDVVHQYLNFGDTETYVDGIFRYGFKGFEDMTNEELEAEYEHQLGEFVKIDN